MLCTKWGKTGGGVVKITSFTATCSEDVYFAPPPNLEFFLGLQTWLPQIKPHPPPELNFLIKNFKPIPYLQAFYILFGFPFQFPQITPFPLHHQNEDF